MINAYIYAILSLDEFQASNALNISNETYKISSNSGTLSLLPRKPLPYARGCRVSPLSNTTNILYVISPPYHIRVHDAS